MGVAGSIPASVDPVQSNRRGSRGSLISSNGVLSLSFYDSDKIGLF